MRSVPEWRGQTDDDAIPTRVMLRIFERYAGTCACCGRKIMVGEGWCADHITALVNGGEHRERNLQPLLAEHHKNKTRADVAIKSKNNKRRAKHLGIKRKSSFQTNKTGKWKKKISGEVVLRAANPLE